MKIKKKHSDIKREVDKGPKSNTVPAQAASLDELPSEFGGPKGLEPTRYGDWEKNGRVSDF
ncbi:MAG TPA: DUF1674 domain-containing protein [Alphaproteobacteria bacterium]|nr:DUF1674 domain-containing protein [Alphaproteobacteria bacterium]